MRASSAVLAVLLLAGCAAKGPSTDGPELVFDERWHERALESGAPHDHKDRSQHLNLTTPNFSVVGYDPLLSPSLDRTPGGHFCGDAAPVEDGRRLAALEMREVGGFILADVTDPSAPRVLGEFVMRHSRVYDVGVAPDGKHVLLVTTDQGLPERPVMAPKVEWRTPCAAAPVGLTWPSVTAGAPATEDPIPRPSSLILVNVEDPAEPYVVDQRPIPNDGHSVFSTRIDGRVWVLVATYYPAGANGYYQFYELLPTPAGTRLNLLSQWEMPFVRPNEEGRLDYTRVHDGWIAKHPGTGQTLAYLSGGEEVHIVDLADPRAPRLVSRWTDVRPGLEGRTGHFHSAYALPELWEGRHYTIIGPEYRQHPQGIPSGVAWVLDTTDPARPAPVTAWTLPHDPLWEGDYMFSNHYYTVVDRVAFFSMYHGGVWAADLSAIRPAEFTLLPSIGVFMADRTSPEPPLRNIRWTPNNQEVLAMPDGTLVTFDGDSGLYTIRFDATRPAPAPEPWPIERP